MIGYMAKPLLSRAYMFGIVAVIIILLQVVLIGFLASRIYSVWQTKSTSKDSAIVPFTQDTVSRPDSDLPGFYEPKPDTVNEIEPDWLGKKIVHSINHDGLRDLDDYTLDKPANVFRIAVLGDSFTYGLFVNDSDVYSEKLERLLNTPGRCASGQKVEVINFGVPGYDVEMSAYRYNIRGKKYDPDLVVWYLIENDFIEYTSFTQDLWISIKEILIAENIPYGKFAPQTAETLGGVITGNLGDVFIPDHQERKLRDWVNDIDVPFVVFSDTTLPEDYQRRIKNAIADTTGGMYFDSLKYSNAYAEGHPSPESHTVIAKSLAGFLSDHNLVPCQNE